MTRLPQWRQWRMRSILPLRWRVRQPGRCRQPQVGQLRRSLDLGFFMIWPRFALALLLEVGEPDAPPVGATHRAHAGKCAALLGCGPVLEPSRSDELRPRADLWAWNKL